MSKGNKVTLNKADVLHAARNIVQMELMLNIQIEKFLNKLGLTKEEVSNRGENNSIPKKKSS